MQRKLGTRSRGLRRIFPVQERLIKGAKTDPAAVFLVDIGGSVGHDLAEFVRKHPDTSGRLVLQDLSVVLGQIVFLDERIERTSYDFYTEQPLKGEFRWLFIRNVHILTKIRGSRVLHALSAPRLARRCLRANSRER